MASRSQRSILAQQTVSILQAGHYTGSDGETHEIGSQVDQAVSKTRLYSPALLQQIDQQPAAESNGQAVLEVTGEGGVGGARRLAELYSNVTLLNFASAKNPCGGMLGGSRAQEESIGVCSSLHSCLTQKNMQEGYYSLHRATPRNGRYSHATIWSPGVVLIREEPSFLLSKPLAVNIITSPAINLGVFLKSGGSIETAMPEMRKRMEYVLSLAAEHKTDALVLGAWGCGVFKWPPRLVAIMFKELLLEKGLINCFKHIVFALASDKEFHSQFDKFNYENFNTFTEVLLNQ